MTHEGQDIEHITPEMRQKIAQFYGRKAAEDDVAPSNDVTVILDHILAMSEQDALDILVHAIDYHRGERCHDSCLVLCTFV